MDDSPQHEPSTSATSDPQEVSAELKDVTASKDELLERVDGLKQDLQEWRTRLNGQVQGYQAEIGSLRSKLLGEMEALKAEFLGLRVTLQQQMAATWAAVGRPEQDATTSEAPVVAQAAEDA